MRRAVQPCPARSRRNRGALTRPARATAPRRPPAPACARLAGFAADEQLGEPERSAELSEKALVEETLEALRAEAKELEATDWMFAAGRGGGARGR